MECAGDSNTNAEDSAVENIARIANAVQVSKCPLSSVTNVNNFTSCRGISFEGVL